MRQTAGRGHAVFVAVALAIAPTSVFINLLLQTWVSLVCVIHWSGGRVLKPRRILDRSASILQREDGLTARALVVSVLNGSADSILTTIAGRFEIEVTSLAPQCFGPARFLLILLTAEMMERVYDGGRLIITSSIRLHVMRWTRFLQSTVASLPSVVEVDIQGISAHAWELTMAELLLNEYFWISGIHPDTADRRDSFRVVAWCSSPSNFPSEMELEIVEPTMMADDLQPGKRTNLPGYGLRRCRS